MSRTVTAAYPGVAAVDKAMRRLRRRQAVGVGAAQPAARRARSAKRRVRVSGGRRRDASFASDEICDRRSRTCGNVRAHV